MHAQNLAILKGLVCVAWADGKISNAEHGLIGALLQTFAATASEALEVQRFAETARSIGDVPIYELSYDDRRLLLHQAVTVMLIDGEKHDREAQLIDELCEVLRIPSLEARAIVETSEQNARSLALLLRA